jgi:hypothetical protein
MSLAARVQARARAAMSAAGGARCRRRRAPQLLCSAALLRPLLLLCAAALAGRLHGAHAATPQADDREPENAPRAYLLARTPSCAIAPGFRTDCQHISTCACYAECEALHAFLGLPGETLWCYNHTRSASSTLDDVMAAPTILFGRTLVVASGGEQTAEVAEPEAWMPLVPSGDDVVLHPRACGGELRSCLQHGWCKDNGTRCQCFDGWQGAACELAAPTPPCLNACTRRGACVAGVCACERGRHGVDCSLPLASDAADTGVRPRIFIYELPPAFNVWREMVAIDRNPSYLLWERLLVSPYRTARGEDADFFFVPVSAMGSVSHGVPILAAQYIGARWPYWARGRGRHLFVWSFDFGPCWVSRHPGLAGAVHISHYGLTVREGNVQCTCDLCGAAYVPGKDIVIPSTLEFETILASPFAWRDRAGEPPRNQSEVMAIAAAAGADAAGRRFMLLFFGGKPSGPERERILALDVRSQRDVKIVQSGGADLAFEMTHAVFCIGAPGAGYGTRAVLAVLLGCIPVLVGDYVEPPFEAELDWPSFSVRVRDAQLEHIVDIVRAITPREVAAMQRTLACVWRFFSWSSLWGSLAGEDGSSDAFEVLMFVLRERALYGSQRRKLGCEAVPGGWAPPAPLCRAGKCADGLSAMWPHGGAAAVAAAAAATDAP